MARFYDQATSTYDDAATAYDGSVSNYVYAGNINIVFNQSYNVLDIFGGIKFYYNGSINTFIYLSAIMMHRTQFATRIAGLFARIVPNSIIVITQKVSAVQDEIVNAGCPQCGTLLYNNPARGTRG